jgi:alkaline phosphatase D
MTKISISSESTGMMTSSRLLKSLCFLSLCTLSVSDSAAASVDFEHPETKLEKLAFGSCHKRKYANAPIWESVKAEEADAWLWTGDAVYPPARGIASVALLEEEYRQMKENTTLGYSDFKPPAGIYGSWDDHDYGGNDAGDEMPAKKARATAFWDFLGLNPPGVDRQGLYSTVSWGTAPEKVQAILLDTRWNRQNHCVPSFATRLPLGAGIACVTRWLSAGLWPRLCSPSALLLGEEQWAWLEDLLSSEENDASVMVIVSSIQVFTTNPVMESWGHFPAERDRLVRLLSKASERQGIVLLSGDVHHGEILDPAATTSAAAASFLEVTSSGLTHDCSMPFYGAMCQPLLDGFADHRFASSSNYYIGRNYGSLSVDWSSRTFTVQVHNVTGASVLTTGPRPFGTRRWTQRDLELVAPCMDGHLVPMALTTLLAAAVMATLLVSQWRLKRK